MDTKRKSFQPIDIYVSVDGDVQADGSLANPYGSFPDAVEVVRALRSDGYDAPVVIYLREGRYQLEETLVLGMQDGALAVSGEVSFKQYGAGEIIEPHLTIAAYPGEHPVVSGGVPITGWKRLESAPNNLPAGSVGKVWVADMPNGMKRFYTLYDGQGRLNRARNSGFAYAKQGDKRTLHFPKGAMKNWDNLEDVEIQVRPGRAWAINMLPLASVDEGSCIATTGASATYEMGPLPGYLHDPEASVVWVENILEALDEPGEWVVNTETRKVYLWPSDPAPDGSPRGILAPTTTELIRVEGKIDYDGPTDTPVRGIAFSGLTFSHADRWPWKSDENRVGWGMQHDWDMFDRPTALLRFRGAEECQVTDCLFINSGGSGLRMDLHAQRNRVIDSEFKHLGEAGILLAGYGPGTKDANHHNDIINNYIHHFSEITWHSPGLWAWQSGHNRMIHNALQHSGYSAVLITTRVEPGRSLNGEGGRTIRQHEIAAENKDRPRRGYESWKIREKYNHARHNLLEYNEISHSVQLLSDGNGIYVSGTGKGNIIRYNYLHDNVAHSLPAAIRCDDDQHETLIFGNVLYNNGGFAAGIASKGINDIINNFIVDPVVVPRWGYVSFEWVPVPGSKVYRNIIMSHPDGGNAYGERARGENPPPKLVETDMDANLYYHPTDSHWMDAHFLKMQTVGKEKASLFGDPLFVNPAGGDFSFRPGSPTLALGIEPLDTSKMGRVGDSSSIRRPVFNDERHSKTQLSRAIAYRGNTMNNKMDRQTALPFTPLPTRPLGKTGVQVSIYGLGGLYTVSRHDLRDEAMEIINRAIDLGVNYIDTSARYGAGASELNIGMVMKERRDEVFLATKSHDDTYDGTMALISQSLRRLQTDHIDLYQHHQIGRITHLEKLQQKHSARQAFERLRDEGVVRFIGVTGHSPRWLADALEDYPYDCALMILNAAREEMLHPEDLDRFFRVVQEKEVGVIAMKVVARGKLIERGLDIRQLLPYTLSYPISTAILGISDIAHLEENVSVIKAFEPLNKEQMALIEALAQG